MKHKLCLLIAFVSIFSTSVQAKDLVDTLNSVDNGLQKLQNSIQQSKRQILIKRSVMPPIPINRGNMW